MGVTDELRSLLDELGIEWIETAPDETRWFSTVLNGNVSARRVNDKLVLFTGYKLITPEQSIAATLGAGTCRRVRGHRSYRTQGGYRIECSECGYGLADRRYRYCPNCGRRVVSE